MSEAVNPKAYPLADASVRIDGNERKADLARFSQIACSARNHLHAPTR